MTNTALAAAALAMASLVQPGVSVAGARLIAITGAQPRSKLANVPTDRLLPVVAAIAAGLLVSTAGDWRVGLPVAGITWFGARHLLRKPAPPVDPLRLAAAWDLLAAGLRAGLPVPDAVRAIADRVPGDGGRILRTTAELLALGADPATAWDHAVRHPVTATLARSARRTARSGAELATVAAGLAADVRAAAHDLSEARAQRAGVLISGPLGVCFLPAFVCLGVAPVVVGLAGQLRLAG